MPMMVMVVAMMPRCRMMNKNTKDNKQLMMVINALNKEDAQTAVEDEVGDETTGTAAMDVTTLPL